MKPTKIIILVSSAICLYMYLSRQPQATHDESTPSKKINETSPSAKQEVNEPAASPVIKMAEQEAPKYVNWASHRIRDLSHKPIRTSEEEQQWEEILSSPESLKRAEERILQVNASLPLETDQRERMNAVLILMRALEWKKNPGNNRVIEVVRKLINDESVDQIKSIEVKRSLVADRIELFVTLKETFPEEAERIERQAAPLQKSFISWANNFYSLKKGNI